ncbi:ABC transporter ATP-binding protein [Mesobacillus jeotgali]|jgi:ABC-2 type transport system ATP-binding protein|uniref:ABC transporter ATP-binding protein n=1 Tax=Mesobacillus jeotgali TaxID=129985 RepID=A0ABY9VLH7_9BACI|nr:ABC transporter ATP-binding protein [Mesobacillus jeotgali]WNF24573.1 ABC transporter ATP-binding protein [Mesobacillus jeotgali]
MEVLEVVQLTKRFKEFEAVKDVSFSVKKGESFGLLGPNGAGKTTTIQMISGLFPPSSGGIRIAGIDMVRQPKQGQGLLGIVPQEIALYQQMSARENLSFWGRMYGLSGSHLQERIKEVLDIIGLTDRAGEKVETFSGGMKRRVNIGAAILHNPELLIMDEPTVGIDPQSRSHILDTVKRLNAEGMTVIYTSHYMEEVEYLCEKIGIMDQGEFIVSGTISELRETIGDRSRIVMNFSGAAKLENLKMALAPSIPEHDLSINHDELAIFHKEPQKVLSELIQTVTGAGFEITSVEVVEPNLESVFLHLTGRSLRD